MEQFLNKLYHHAALLIDNENPETSLTFSLRQATKTKVRPIILELREDILSCLEALNLAVNGNPPTAQTTDVLARDVSLAVGTIINACCEHVLIWERDSLFDASDRDLLKQTAWILSSSWCYILHGDIESIHQEVLWERQTKDL